MHFGIFFSCSPEVKNQNCKSIADVAGISIKPLHLSNTHKVKAFQLKGFLLSFLGGLVLRTILGDLITKTRRSWARPSIRCASSKSLTCTFLPRVFLAVVSSPHRQQHLSSSTFKRLNLRESQYPPRKQAGLFSRSQFETEYLNTSPASVC